MLLVAGEEGDPSAEGRKVVGGRTGPTTSIFPEGVSRCDPPLASLDRQLQPASVAAFDRKYRGGGANQGGNSRHVSRRFGTERTLRSGIPCARGSKPRDHANNGVQAHPVTERTQRDACLCNGLTALFEMHRLAVAALIHLEDAGVRSGVLHDLILPDWIDDVFRVAGQLRREVGPL